MSKSPQLSPRLQALIDKGLFDQIPVTFSTFFYDRIQQWNLLFPAEQDYYERLFALLDRSEQAASEKLFAPLRVVEKKMGVNERIWPRRQFTLDQVDFLNRSAHYPEWRRSVADIFAKLDPLLDAEAAAAGHPRLVVVLSPAELPVAPDRMWTRFRHHGRVVPIDVPVDIDPGEYASQLLTGARRADRRPHLARLYAGKGERPPYDTWIVEAADKLSSDGQVHLSYERLQDYRSRLMAAVRTMLDKEDVRGPRQLGARLKQLAITPNEPALAADPVLADFVRSILLSGNGTLLLNNTFVEWATVQAVRRARPSVMLVSFGIRNKIKPFSSLLIYADQETTTPIPSQVDTLGSYVDLEVLTYYVWLEFEKYGQYRRNTVYLFAGEGMDAMLVLAPRDFLDKLPSGPVRLEQMFELARDWLGV